MLDLTRSVRFCINDAVPPEPAGWGPADNTFAAYPSMRGLGRFYELRIRCRGKVSPSTGYFLNIKEIDQAVRSVAIPLIARTCRERPQTDPATVLHAIVPLLDAALGGRVAGVRWLLTPYYSVEMSAPASNPPPAEPRALLRQQFEFAASHRLHCANLSDAENRALFGKCNHAGGHGHNYRVEPCVETPIGAAGAKFPLAELERITARTVIDRFDHKHLNADNPEFDTARGGVNPSVENIARVCFDLLKPEIARACPEASLRSVTVWETDKTWCTYPAGEEE
jgi:6-pyruvoyltetrahydropterin/6-carboxytetrahydropterin synthase